MFENKNNNQISNQNHFNQIKIIISSQDEEIKRIQSFLTDIIGIYNEYINISKEFSKKLENLALKLKPDGKTFEGQLVQAFQTILLFNSNSLNEMTDEMSTFFNKHKKENTIENDGVGTFKYFTQVYFEQYNKTMDSYKEYESEIESYENYLIKKELGLIKEECTPEDKLKVSSGGNKSPHNKTNNTKNINNNKELYDNNKEASDKQRTFLNNMRASNEVLQKLFNYFTEEKNKMLEQIFNYCHSFNDNIISCLKKQNETCLNQKLLLDNLNKENNLTELEDKELNKHFLMPNPYSLKCLKMEEEEEEKLDGKKLQIKNKNKLTIEKKLHILQTFRDKKLLLNEQDKTKEKVELNKQEISDTINIIFNKTHLYDDTLKQKIISLLNDETYQLHFLKILNKYRTKGKFILTKTSLKNLGNLFQYLNEFITDNVDINLFKLFFIMCLTFYYQDSETFKRYYLLKYVENHQKFKNKKFWENYLSGLINLDIESNNNKEDKDKEKDKIEEPDINYIIFSNIISVTKSMSDFHLGKGFIDEFLEEITKNKYNLNEEQKVQINYILIDNEYGSFNENDRSTVSTDFNELNQSSFINNSIDNIDFSLIRTSNISLIENRNSSISKNNDYILNRISNYSNSNDATSQLHALELKKEDDEGSLESIEIEEMNKND